MIKFCDIFSELRKDFHLSQQKMAEILNVSPGTISNYETGRYTPSYETLIRIADYFGVTTDYLLGRTNSAIPGKKLEEEFIPGRTMGEFVDILLSIHNGNRELINKMVDVIRIYDAVNPDFAEKPR